MRKFLHQFSIQSKLMVLMLIAFSITSFYNQEPSTRWAKSNWGFWFLVFIQVYFAIDFLYESRKNHRPISGWDKINLILPLGSLLLIAILDRIIHQSWLLN